jgi:hypothetical protein
MSGVVKAITGIVKGIVKAVVGVVKAVVNVVSSVVSFITQPFMGLFGGMPGAPDAAGEADRQQGILVTRTGSTVNIPVVYGLRRVGGTITFAETGADENKYLWVAYALSEGPVEGLFELFIDDNQLATKYIPLLNNGQTVTIDEGKFSGRIVMRFSHGKHFATPSSSTVGGTWNPCNDAPSWKDSMVYNGCATLFVRYEWKHIETQEDSDANPFNGNIPAIKTTLLGRKVATITSSSGSTAYDSETENYSTNPAEILVDFLRNPRYGKGLKNSDIDWNSFLIAKNKYNTVVTYTTGDATGPIITNNFVLDTGQSLFANVKTLLMGCRSYLPFSQGKYKLKVEDAGNATDITSGVATIVQTFNSDNIQGAVTYQAIERSSKYNVVEVNYVNPDKAYSVEAIIYPETLAERQTYIDKDGGRVNKLTATFPTITNYAIAKDMARLLFNKSRFQESVSFTASSQALELEVGDNIRVQSTMLNFSTTPFRVITMKINNDMTVDLGCVRNDDSLYPHTRVGEEDVVLPPYIPKGGEIFYPEIIGGYPIGLVPPNVGPVPITHRPPQIYSTTPGTVANAGTHDISVFGQRFYAGLTAVFIGDDGTEYTPGATTRISDNSYVVQTIAGMTSANQPYDIKFTNPSANGSLSTRANNCLTVNNTVITPDPPITDPPIVEDPDDPSITPPITDPPAEDPDPPADPPEPPAVVYTTDEFVEFTKVEYTTEGQLVYATITGIQPGNPAYKELSIYYKRNVSSETVFQQMIVTTKPGSEQSFTFRVGPLLPSSSYTLISRVKYSGGELSSRVNKINLDTRRTSEDPQDYVEQANTGWPTDPGSPTTLLATPFNSIVGATVLTGGAPKNPKEITFTVKQEILNAPANFDVTGVAYYIKSSAASTWTRYETAFTGTYIPGASATFAIAAGSVGTPSHPSTPSAAQQNYDFVFRFLFKDGKESTLQTRYMNVKTEYSGVGTYQFDPLYGGELPRNEKSSDYAIDLGDPGAPSAASSMVVRLTSVEATLSGAKQIRFFFRPPDSSVQASWVGMRIRYRKVTPGQDPAFETFESTSVGIYDGFGREFLEIDYDSTYEFIVTALYNSSGVRTDSTQSFFGVGYVHRKQTRDDFPSNSNWLSTFNFKQMTTAQALKDIDTAFPAPPNPIVDVVGWSMINKDDWKGASDPFAYYKLTFNHHAVPSFASVNIYRRSNAYGAVSDSNNTFYGKGRWEKINITSFESSPTSTTVFLRPPLSEQEYNPYYTIGGTQDLRRSFYTNTTNGYGPTSNDEFLVVAVQSGGEVSKGVLLGGGDGVIFVPELDLLLGQRAIEVDVASFNGMNAALEKNISQAVTAITPANASVFRNKKWSDNAVTTSPTIV